VVKRQRNIAGQTRIEFWQRPGFSVAAGDQLQLVAGCDKQFATCTAKFNNAANFRGFPHMPGNDFVTTFPRQGDPANDGGRRG
jgi:uncharacterized phage protein (TIGR02218 family)